MGLRLALGGDRSARVRLILMSAGVAAAVALLLGVAGAGPAALQRLEAASTRDVAYSEDAGTRTTGVRAETSVGFWRGQPLRVLDVETVGPPVRPPPGMASLPEPGEVLVSPALARALAGPRGAELAPRLHGRVIGTIGTDGLVGPDELFAVAGVPPGRIAGDLFPGFATPRPPETLLVSEQNGGTVTSVSSGISDELRAALLVAAIGLVVPLMVLVGTATRLSAAARERRAAALRLVGATSRQVSSLGGIESALVGGLGVLAGAALFLALRAPVAAIVPVPGGVFAAEVVPPRWSMVLIAVGVPLLTATSGLLAVRRAARRPLDVRRQAVPPTPSFARLIPLAVGLLLLIGAFANASAVLSGRWDGTVLLLGGALLCLVGLAVAGPALARGGGLMLDRVGRTPAAHLAGRRLVLDPAAASRTVTGTALVVAVVGWVLAFLPLLATTTPAGQGVLAAALRPATVVAEFSPAVDATEVVAALPGVPGAGPVVGVRRVQLLRPGTTPPAEWAPDQPVDPEQFPIEAVVADCAALSSVLRTPLRGCGTSTTYRLEGPYAPPGEAQPGRYTVLDRDGRSTELTAAVPADLPVLELPKGLALGIDGFQLNGQVLFTELPAVPGMGAGPRAPDAVLVGTDGDPDTIEAVRAALGPLRTPFPPLTAEEATLLARSASDGFARVALIGLALVVLVGGLSLAVTTADGLRERRNAHAALAAMGAPVRILRRSVLLQTATPLVLSVGLALAVSAAASWLYLHIGATPEVPTPPLPWAGYGLVGASAIAASLLATAAALPFVRSAVHPEALRAE